jgi:hypothetical protein
MDSAAEQSWGARINTTKQEPRRLDAAPLGCPVWAEPYDRMNWQRRGVVVWDNDMQRLQVVSSIDTVKLLDHLRSTEEWKAEGVVITRRTSYMKQSESPLPPRRTRSRKKREQTYPAEQPELAAPAPTPEKPEWVTVDEERIRLRGQAALDFFALLAANEVTLRQMADEDERCKQEALSRVYAILFRSYHEREAKELDPSTRPLPWSYNVEALTWMCDQPPNRGTVYLTKNNWSWEGCIEQPDRFKRESPWFMELKEALDWVEQKLIAIQHAAEEAAKVTTEQTPPRTLSAATLTEEERARLAPYWIEPAAFEPKHKTYRVYIALDYAPHSFKTWELSFGKKRRYDEQYAYPEVVARELQLDPIQMIIEQPFGSNDGWNRIHSRVTYYQEYVAAAQAQQVWDRSRIVQQHSAGKVERARYGFQEVETGYSTWLGGCEDSKQPWLVHSTRAEHLADMALRETLIHALDVDGFRAFTGIAREHRSDEALLRRLHQLRAESKYIPEAAREKSTD